MSVLSWNEHGDIPYTSRHYKQQVEHNRKNLGEKKYKKKTNNFVNNKSNGMYNMINIIYYDNIIRNIDDKMTTALFHIETPLLVP